MGNTLSSINMCNYNYCMYGTELITEREGELEGGREGGSEREGERME